MKICLRLIGPAAVAVLLAGCGGGGEDGATATQSQSPTTTAAAPEKPLPKRDASGRFRLRVSLDSEPGAENVGIVMAAKLGLFKKEGLDVWFGSPLDPSRPVQYVSKGIDDFGVAQLPQVLVGGEKGAEVVAVGSLIPRPTESMIWLRGSGIRNIADLRGKKIGFPGIPFQKGFLEEILARAGLGLEDVKLRNVGYEMVSSLVDGQADAIFGGSWNLEGVDPALREARPEITRVEELGIPPYEEDVVIARSRIVKEAPQVVRKFMSAVARGNAAALADPNAASDAIRTVYKGVPDTRRQAREAQLEATLPLLARDSHMDSRQAQRLAEWMYESGLVEREWPVSEFLTNALH